MFRSKGRNPLVSITLLTRRDRIPNGENTRIKNTNNIPAISFLDHLPLTCHHLLRLGETNFLPTLDVESVHPGVEFPGADPHESDTVPVRFIHIGLDLKDKGRKVLLCHRINIPFVRMSRKRRSRHLQKML